MTYFLKDEAPKAPVYIYSINNSNKISVDEEATEEERTNAITRQNLMDLNHSLYLGETLENIELMIPFDKIHIGDAINQYFGQYNPESVFHQSSIHSLVYQNIYNILQNKSDHVDMIEFAV